MVLLSDGIRARAWDRFHRALVCGFRAWAWGRFHRALVRGFRAWAWDRFRRALVRGFRARAWDGFHRALVRGFRGAGLGSFSSGAVATAQARPTARVVQKRPCPRCRGRPFWQKGRILSRLARNGGCLPGRWGQGIRRYCG